MDRHPVRQDHLPESRGRQRPAGKLRLAPPPASTGFTLPLLLWLVVQLAAVALTAGRFPLWAKYPGTGETLALQALLITQLIASTLLFPVLLPTVRSTVVLIATAWPFALGAAALSSSPIRAGAWAESYVCFWLFVLWAWGKVVRSPRGLATASAIVICLVLSGPIYRYLLTDFSAGSSAWWVERFVQATPMEACLGLGQSSHPAVPLIALTLLLLVSALTLFVQYRARSISASPG